MFKSKWFAMAGASVLCFATVWVTNAQAPAQEPSFAVYCRGPLRTFRTEGGKVIRTPFKWAKEAASKANPGAGECAWADDPPQGVETKPGESGAILGNLGPFDSTPVGTIGKVCVSKRWSCAKWSVSSATRPHRFTDRHLLPRAVPASAQAWKERQSSFSFQMAVCAVA